MFSAMDRLITRKTWQKIVLHEVVLVNCGRSEKIDNHTEYADIKRVIYHLQLRKSDRFHAWIGRFRAGCQLPVYRGTFWRHLTERTGLGPKSPFHVFVAWNVSDFWIWRWKMNPQKLCDVVWLFIFTDRTHSRHIMWKRTFGDKKSRPGQGSNLGRSEKSRKKQERNQLD